MERFSYLLQATFLFLQLTWPNTRIYFIQFIVQLKNILVCSLVWDFRLDILQVSKTKLPLIPFKNKGIDRIEFYNYSPHVTDWLDEVIVPINRNGMIKIEVIDWTKKMLI